MGKVAVVYWSGTGNTEAMAAAVENGAQQAGAETSLMHVSAFDVCQLSAYDALAFGCPSMGVEVLEEEEFAPVFNECLPRLAGRRIALFGSYGWGDGAWMRTWEADCMAAGAVLACPSVICCGAPDDEAVLAQCAELGAALAR